MTKPDREEALEMLREAESMNPGKWIDHSRVTAFCAERIGEAAGLDRDTSYVCGLLHDIGRRYGVFDMAHLIRGYRYMTGLGYERIGRICLTHSFPSGIFAEYCGRADIEESEQEFIRGYVETAVYDDYDRLIQLCDALAFAEHPVCVERRLVDVALRYGISEYTLPKWRAVLGLKDYFDEKAGTDIYSLIGVKG